MTQIANIRRFDGSDDTITLALGSLVAFGPGTVAAIVKRASDTTNDFLFAAGSVVGQSYEFYVWNDDSISLDINGNAGFSALTLLAANDWALIAATKATGSVAVRFHKYVFSTTTWTHTDGNALANGSAPATAAYMGSTRAAGGPWHGDIAVGGVWNVALSDVQLEGLTAAITAWEDLNPIALWLLDQTVTTDPVLDRIGNADETALVGTTVVEESGLEFDVGGEVEEGAEIFYVTA